MQTCPICTNKKTEFFHTVNHFSYYRCNNCTTLSLYPQPSKKDIDEYYKKNFVYSAGEANESQIRRRAKKVLHKLKGMNPSGRTLLDIGSGYGFFLDEAKKSNLDIIGIEPSKELYKNSIKFTRNITFEDFNRENKNKKYDFISLIHVIEHVDNPREMLQKASFLLTKGGILYIETPNLNSHLFHEEKYQYTFLTPPDHIWIFSFKSFEYLLREGNGIEVIQKTTYSQPEHFMGILKKKLEVRSEKLEAKNESKKMPFKSSNIQPPTSNISRLKYLVFDRFLSPLLTPLLNIGGYGSILEVYIKKK